MVYDVSGKINGKRRRLKMELILSGINAPEQVFIVKVFLINGQRFLKKIIRNPNRFTLNPIRYCEWDFSF
jgi:hypothetical protein